MSDALANPGTHAKGGKHCRVCGKDLEGKPRMKDDRGYLCGHCGIAEEKKESHLVRCPECRRKLKPAGLVPFRDRMICKQCFMHHEEMKHPKVAKVDTSLHHARERRSIIKLAVVLALLGTALLLNFLGVL